MLILKGVSVVRVEIGTKDMMKVSIKMHTWNRRLNSKTMSEVLLLW